jgi:N-acyl-D-aspartate/D-glutamate deacylase
LLLGLQATINPFVYGSTYQELAKLPLAERVAKMRDPEVKARVVAEYHLPRPGYKMAGTAPEHMDRIFRLGDPPNYEPNPDDAIGRVAQREGRDPIEYVYDMMLEKDGRELLYFAGSNFTERNLDNVREMIISPNTLFGLSDGGAHVGTICDASFPTTNVTLWTRDRTRGRLTLEEVMKGQSADTARHVGWNDRGVLAPGYKADINVIDVDNLRLRRPELAFDLPAGGKRLLQRAEGYRWTIKSGEVTFEDGRSTGAFPGRVVRGAQPAPA